MTELQFLRSTVNRPAIMRNVRKIALRVCTEAPLWSQQQFLKFRCARHEIWIKLPLQSCTTRVLSTFSFLSNFHAPALRGFSLLPLEMNKLEVATRVTMTKRSLHITCPYILFLPILVALSES